MSGGGEPPDDGQEPRKVEDAGEVNKLERLRAIHRRWEEAMERGTEAKDAAMNGADEASCRKHYRVGVENLLTELCSLGEDAGANSPWHTANLGTVIIEPPPAIGRELQTGGNRLLAPPPKPKRHVVAGLKGYLETDWPISATFRLVTGTPRTPTETVETVERGPPIGVSDRAMQAARRFMTANGIDFDLHEDQHRAVITEDLMKEVEEWRKQNIK